MRASLEKWGQLRPIIVQRRGMVVRAGNAVLAAAQALDWRMIAAVVVDEDDVAAAALAIADNRTAELSTWDETLLGEILGELQDDPDFDQLLTGFTDAEIGRLRSPVAGLVDPDAVPPLPEAAATRPGDLWHLGDHRLLCGDATNAADVAEALAGERPFLMVTDPPYGVSYDPTWRTDAGMGSACAARGTVRNDDRSDWRDAWALFPGAVAYVWHGGLHAGVVAESLHASKLVLRAQIVWVKSRPAISRGAYHWQHEPAWYAAREGEDDRWRFVPEHEVAAYVVRKGESAAWGGGRRQSTVWHIDHRKNDTGHGTQKPVECMERPIRNHGEPGDAVYDPFLGSGTTLIAAERSRRRCFGLELDPAYCDVIVRRWEEYTGRKAQLAASSRSGA